LCTSIHHGYLPIWDGNTYGGKNFPGEFQAGIFYPLNILFCLLFGSADGIDPYYLDLLIVLHFFICVIGMYALSRVLKLSRTASIVTALVFTFTGVISERVDSQANIFYSLCLMPWPIYFLSKYYFVQRRKKYLVFSGLIAGMQIVSGHMQPFFHTLVICGIMILVYEYQNRNTWKTYFSSISINFLLIVAVAFIISFPQLYYSFEYMSSCYRWVGADHALVPGEKVPFSVYAYVNIIKPSDIANMIGRNYNRPADDNNIYIGILPLFLFLVYAIKSRRLSLPKENILLTRFLFILIAVGIASVLGYLTFFCAILWEIPFVNTIRELGRYSILLGFSFSILAGLAITHILELGKSLFQNLPKTKFYVLLALTATALYWVIFQSALIERQVSIAFLGAFLFFLLLMRFPKKTLIYTTLLAVVLVDLYLNHIDYKPANTANYPTTFFRRTRMIDSLEKTYGKYRVAFEIQNNDSLRRNIGDIFNIQTKLGYCATMNMRYDDYLASDWGLNSEVLDLLNVKYIVTDRLMDSTFTYVDSMPNTYLYERKNCYPRAYWKSQIGRPGRDVEKENAENIRQLIYSDLYQRTEVNCLTSDTLIFAENYYPGWKCYDNTKEIPIKMPTIKTHPPLFRAIALDKGHHIIEFKYASLFRWR